jgi:uncharacterized RDD family membrane protein YckC
MSSGPFAPPPPPPLPGAPVTPTPVVVEPPSFAGYTGAVSELTGAGFGIRLLARLIDTAIHYCIGIAAGLFVGILLGLYSAFAHQPVSHLVHRAQGGAFVFLFALLGSVAYHSVCESVHGSSAGKMLLSLVVVTEDGKPCGFKAALIRSAAYFVDALVFGLIGYLAMQNSPSNSGMETTGRAPWSANATRFSHKTSAPRAVSCSACFAASSPMPVCSWWGLC